ncbi:MAG: hypothetical protein M3Y08_10670 [Fibrobacterota bacterium]|nr:hypothetical protein [Fibrobacterota bacterium]
MKSIMLELIPIEPGLDELLVKIQNSYQIVPDSKIINRIKKDSIENIADGKDYKIFENTNWLISGKIDDEEPESIWIEVFKK